MAFAHRAHAREQRQVHFIIPLFFRDQTLDRDSLKRVTEVFAPLIRVPYITPSPEDADIIAVRKEASEKKDQQFRR